MYELMRHLSVERIGLVPYTEFKAVFHVGDELESKGIYGADDSGSSSLVVIEPRNIPEIFEEEKVSN